MDRNRAEEIIHRVLSLSDADETEVLLSTSQDDLTRFSGNVITQNVARSTDRLTVKVHLGRRLGRASTDRLDEDSLKRVVATAKLVASQQKEDPSLLPLPPPFTFSGTAAWFPLTAAYGPEERANAISRLVREGEKYGATAAGIFNTASGTMALGNSRGLFGYHRETRAVFSATVEADGASGWAEEVHRDVALVNEARVIETAIEKALAARHPGAIEPGEYAVVLEPAAVCDFLMFMAWESFGGLNYLEGRSFMSGKLGQKVMGDNVTIVDDAYSAHNPGLPFDYEGSPRQRLILVKEGLARGVAHDRLTAARAGIRSTGHSLPQPNTVGPLPLNLILEPGEATLEEMIAATPRGILVTHFHYTNVQDPIKLILTGMTRDGTFLIEEGRVTRPLLNLRFTDSAVAAFNRIEMISRDQVTSEAFFGGSFVAPALKISRFHFTSVSEF
ncbi:MAG: TldD/PmbA family protein [Candidatus Zixiibacteriota bacterium]|nr:MAG: TldD/PmbA family protein [candidate division Zixibacteria bacterium]